MAKTKIVSKTEMKRQMIADAIAKMPKGAIDYPVTRKVTITEAEKPNREGVYFVDFFNDKQFTTQKAESGSGVDVFKRNIENPTRKPDYCGEAESLADAVFGMVTGRYYRFGR
jgi:hypothetical protein